MSGTVVPGYVYDAIDTHMRAGEWTHAWNAIAKALNDYDEPKRGIYNCLWLFHKGAIAAEELEDLEFAIALGNRFVTRAEALSALGPHMLKAQLEIARVRPPRADEIAEARERLKRVEDALRAKRSEEGASPDEIDAEIRKQEARFLGQSKGCLVALLLSPLYFLRVL